MPTSDEAPLKATQTTRRKNKSKSTNGAERKFMDPEDEETVGSGMRQKSRGSREKLISDEPGSSLEGEWRNIFTLMVLYTLQGIPMGLSAAVPMILNEKGVSYSDLGTLSLTSWPFSLKILWAPFVDAMFIPRFGRRKTWLIPTQIAIGLSLMYVSCRIDGWIEPEVHIAPLTFSLFLICFLCATQDVAVDGWALTMLRPENVGYASTCNSAGQIAGYFMAFIGSMALQHFQLASLSEFMQFSGIVFVVVTLLVAVLKKEEIVSAKEKAEMESAPEIYRQLAVCFRIPAVRSLVFVLFVWKLPFAVNDALSGLKLQKAGIPKEYLAYLGLLIAPFQIFVPVLLGKATAGPFPLNVLIHCYLPRVLMGLVALVMVYSVPANEGAPSLNYCIVLLIVSSVGVVLSTTFFCSQMAFFARISDKSIGGTYMTLLNTFANLGGMWTTTMVLKGVDLITVENCNEDKTACDIVYDGYTILMLGCVVGGVLSYPWVRRTLHALQLRDKDDWKIGKLKI